MGQVVQVERDLFQRLVGREDARTPWERFEAGAGEGMVWDHRPVPMPQFRLPEAGPNAPLLKRVIRWPPTLEPAPPVREQVFDASRVDRRRDTAERVQMVFRENAEARVARGPLDDIELGPEDRAHPFRRARDAAEQRRTAEKLREQFGDRFAKTAFGEVWR